MTLTDISSERLKSQMLTFSDLKSAKEIVAYMGAIQAQDYAMSKWAIGARMSDTSLAAVQASIDKGEIIRTHVLRPTWHFISADDVYWMIRLSAQKIISASRTRFKDLELTDSIISKATAILEKSLSDGNSLTRDELATEFQNAEIRTDGTRLSHIMFRAELDGIVCSGPDKNNKPTYSLLSERVPLRKELSRDEALAALANRYFLSRSPATAEDFAWWSNLSITDARKAINFSKTDLHEEIIDQVKYWLSNRTHGKSGVEDQVHLLPAFDEFLIGYTDRSSSLSSTHNNKAVTSNGIFHPPVVINGQVSGLWKRAVQKEKVIVETMLFQQPDEAIIPVINKKAGIFAKFLGKEPEIRHETYRSKT